MFIIKLLVEFEILLLVVVIFSIFLSGYRTHCYYTKIIIKNNLTNYFNDNFDVRVSFKFVKYCLKTDRDAIINLLSFFF